MKKISIAVDLDSTLNNLDEVWILQDYNNMYNDNLKAEDMVEWNTHNYVKPECGRKVYDIINQPGYFRHLGFRDIWTEEGFSWLIQHFDVYIVSSCTPQSIIDKVEWLKEKFPLFDTGRFISCHHKGLINTDYLIDDGPHNIQDFKQKGVLYDAAYNKHLNEKDDGFVRLRNWNEIQDYFQALLLKESTVL